MAEFYQTPYIKQTWQVHPGFQQAPVHHTIALPVLSPRQPTVLSPRQPPIPEQPLQRSQVLDEALNSLKKMRTEIHSKLTDVDTRMRGMDVKLRDVDTGMEEIRDNLRDGMERTRNKFRDVDAGMKVINDKVEIVDTNLERIGTKVMDRVQALPLDFTVAVQGFLLEQEQRVTTALETIVERRETPNRDLLECLSDVRRQLATWTPTQPRSQQTVAAKGSCTRTRRRRKPPVENWDNVKKLHDKRTFRYGKSGVIKYLVEWEGQDKSWEPASNIEEDVPTIVEEFEELNALKNQSRKGRKRRQRL